MKGQKLSELLNDMDDDLLTDAMPPAWKAGDVKAPGQKRHPLRALGRVMDSGWVAAALSVVVSVGVLIGIVSIGRHAARDPESPLPGDTVAHQPGGQPSFPIDPDSTDTIGYPGVAFPDTPPDDDETSPRPADGTESEIGIDTEADSVIPSETIGEPETEDVVPWQDASVVMHMRTPIYVDAMYGLWNGYMYGDSVDFKNPAPGEPGGYNADGMGALNRLPELSQGLVANGCFLPNNCYELAFTVKDTETMTIRRIAIVDPDYNEITYVTGSTLDVSILRASGHQGCYLVLNVLTQIDNDEMRRDLAEEYPVYVTFSTQASGEIETFPPSPVEGFPKESVTFDADAVEKTMNGGSDPEAMDDMEAFVKFYCPTATVEDVTAMIKLMRALPVPVWSSGILPNQAYTSGYSQTLIYTFRQGSMTYEFTLYGSAVEANQRLDQLSLLPEPEKLFAETQLLAISRETDDDRFIWLNMDGTLVAALVTSENGGLTDKSYGELFADFDVTEYRTSETPSEGMTSILPPWVMQKLEVDPPYEPYMLVSPDVICRLTHVDNVEKDPSLIFDPELGPELWYYAWTNPCVVSKYAEGLSVEMPTAGDRITYRLLADSVIYDEKMNVVCKITQEVIDLQALRDSWATTFYALIRVEVEVTTDMGTTTNYIYEYAWCMEVEK